MKNCDGCGAPPKATRGKCEYCGRHRGPVIHPLNQRDMNIHMQASRFQGTLYEQRMQQMQRGTFGSAIGHGLLGGMFR